jgi:hypothetical protein
MKKLCMTLLMMIMSTSCANNLQTQYLSTLPALQIDETLPTGSMAAWAIYDSNPDHIWNRVFRQLYRRTTADGREYGSDELDPLLWFDTTYLLQGDSHQKAIDVLDEFLAGNAEDLIGDPLKRAVFQRDMWAVFDWAASQSEPYPAERRALETRLAQVIKRVALSKEEIRFLPNNYTLAVESKTFSENFQVDHPENAFLPIDLFQSGSAWVPMGREGGPVAMTHTSSFPFLGHSVFLVFVRSPEGRTDTIDFIDSLNTEAHPVLAVGSDVALVRRMLLIDHRGELQLSPLVENVQLRHFRPEQSFYEFELDRLELFNRTNGGLVLNTEIFLLFMSHGDVFEKYVTEQQAVIPEICRACHFETLASPISANTNSIISYSRDPIPLSDKARPILFATTVAEEAQAIIQWKLAHETWKSLRIFMEQ